ncbi:MAG TPA: cytochrome c-type biogenesis protein [Alphaproteobacteria bacterium]
MTRVARRLAGMVLAALMVGVAATAALAFQTDTPLADPAQEARAVALAKELRCLVCQNQSIMESDADLAKDLRGIVRERIAAGDSDAQVKQYVVERYGDFVLLRPPFKAKTWALWLGPALIAAAALAALAAVWRRRASRAQGPAPLTEAERARLRDLLGDDA